MEETKTALRKQLRAFLSKSMYAHRKGHGLSQEKMAEILAVSPRSYIDLEHGRFGFSSLSMACFIISMTDEEAVDFIMELKNVLKGRNGKDA